MRLPQAIVPEKNPLIRLLELLPAQMAARKRKAIEVDLIYIGKLEHYRQSVTRPGWKMGNTHVSCAAVLMQHLGIGMTFFTGTDEERDQQVADLVKHSYETALPELLTS